MLMQEKRRHFRSAEFATQPAREKFNLTYDISAMSTRIVRSEDLRASVSSVCTLVGGGEQRTNRHICSNPRGMPTQQLAPRLCILTRFNCSESEIMINFLSIAVWLSKAISAHLAAASAWISVEAEEVVFDERCEIVFDESCYVARPLSAEVRGFPVYRQLMCGAMWIFKVEKKQSQGLLTEHARCYRIS